jgi:stearoyl-CoA desaturase (delta-9 desaturase)
MTTTLHPPAPAGPATLASPGVKASPVQRIVALLLIVGPIVAVAIGTVVLWGRALHPRDLVAAAVLYAVTGHGITVGFHRMFTHRSFKPNRVLKIALATAGSLAVQGSIISWVADHRRHHMFSDQPGDPHSPLGASSSLMDQARGFAHAHIGWFFRSDPTSFDRFAPDLLADRDIAVINRLFPLFIVITFALPFAVGWALSGSVVGGLTCLLWAGLARMVVLHHVTWSINSVCHMFGRRPYASRDRSTNFWPLAVFSMGESWHNLHHAYPSSARHGVRRGQIDSSAVVIRTFERLGWATKVRWPTAERLAACRSM